MSSSSFDFLGGWTSGAESSEDTEPDISLDEALLLSDLIASVTDKDTDSNDGESERDADRDTAIQVPVPVPDIEDHAYLHLALELEASLPDSGSSASGGDSEYQTGHRHKHKIQQSRDGESTSKDGDEGEDTRSPLERFRRPPMKGLSVSDLVARAWCELQYSYTLLHGYKTTTPAMKRGTVVHQKLENEVHTSIPITVLTKEDAWALRIWNVIYSLRTLRDIGLTREMEVWGIVDGEIVTGVIDCLSYECAQPELQKAVGKYAGVCSTKRVVARTDKEGSSKWMFEGDGQKTALRLSEEGNVYITDVKTKDARRGSRLPGVESPSFKPARIQLQLYYHFLTRLVESEDISIFDIAERYGLKPHAPLSDAFLAQVGSINDDYFENEACSWSQSSQSEAGDGDDGVQRQDSLTVLLNHNSLSNLWDLLKENLRLTFLRPESTSTLTSTKDEHEQRQVSLLSPILTVSYMSQPEPTSPSPPPTETDTEESKTESKTATESESESDTPTPSQADNNYITLGTRSFVFDPDSLYPYLLEGLDWWRGRRPAHAIPVSQAWKCQSCDYRGTCSWRRERFEMHMQKIREKGGGWLG
ncbi:hypothetical protein MGYG_09184 [Nannizzia gypsea CBS 118893]|uniref:Defects in morphology protein 1 n=1 Tax=Arthroderma gypseum (strain ATCC MYA-4604 / CBS 118893) TaxID=535722 RepID=E4V4Y5_ARTGP|nr:hypothetical protein MGYG_09184 [Nannizzia gypsea CBS 118893]EFR05059.1 hypothetical protein MGYG_09184 [Nannizzia gypsea CBS 118893]